MDLGADWIFADKSGVTSECVEEAHIRGLKVVAQAVDAEEDYLLMDAMDIDGIVTDYPDRVISWRFIRYSESSLLALS